MLRHPGGVRAQLATAPDENQRHVVGWTTVATGRRCVTRPQCGGYGSSLSVVERRAGTASEPMDVGMPEPPDNADDLADDVGGSHSAPRPAVDGNAAAVAHHEVMARANPGSRDALG